MKRLICCMIAVLMLLSLLSSVAIAILMHNEIPVSDSDAYVLQKLGIMIGSDEGLELERNITRAEAVVLLLRMQPKFIGVAVLQPFADMEDHWAKDDVAYARAIGMVDGVGDNKFEPDRTVSGKEFAKLILSLMGYKDVTIENVHDKAQSADLILNNFTNSLVSENYTLRRGDAARLCYAALLSYTPDGKMFYKLLIENGIYSEDDFDGLFCSGTPKKDNTEPESFADKLNAGMPYDENYMFSPLSIKMALALLANGAEGVTDEEILAAMQIEDLDEFNASAKEMIDKYSKTDVLKLNISNSIWINKSNTSQRFSEKYKNTVGEFYNAESGEVDNNNALETVNGWVDEKTNGKITGIIDKTNFMSLLVNAIYFKGSWMFEFNENMTKRAIFTNANGEATETDFMNRIGWMNYYDGDNIKIVEMPYNNTENKFAENGEWISGEIYDDIDVSMYLMLTGSGADENNILSELDRCIESGKLTNTFVKLSVPKFEFQYATLLNNIFKDLGIKKAFESSAELNSMFDKGSMFVSDAIHKTYIKVDEKATEAAAVTAIAAGGGMSTLPEPMEFKANRPFYFVIRDNINGELLFVGKYAFPDEEQRVSFQTSSLSMDPDFIIRVPEEILMLDDGINLSVCDEKRDRKFELEPKMEYVNTHVIINK